jgi:hypothetical protein
MPVAEQRTEQCRATHRAMQSNADESRSRRSTETSLAMRSGEWKMAPETAALNRRGTMSSTGCAQRGSLCLPRV